MRSCYIQITFAALLIVVIAVSGCVAPPTNTEPGTTDIYNPPATEVTAGAVGPGGNFVTVATPFAVTPIETQNYVTFTKPTLPPEDLTCLIYFIPFDWRFSPNRTAFAFNLKNPPMYMNYTIDEPYLIKDIKISRDYKGNEITVDTEYPAPFSYLDITIRDRNSGEIYLQDGYSKDYGYYLNNSDIKLTKSGDMLVEVSGYNVTGAVGFWVKPVGNFENNESFENTECVHWVRVGQL